MAAAVAAAVLAVVDADVLRAADWDVDDGLDLWSLSVLAPAFSCLLPTWHAQPAPSVSRFPLAPDRPSTLRPVHYS